MCLCVCVCVHVCVRACMGVCVCVCMHSCVSVCDWINNTLHITARFIHFSGHFFLYNSLLCKGSNSDLMFLLFPEHS